MKFLSIKSLSGGALAAIGASLTALVVIWHLSTPVKSGPLGILVVFTLIYVFFTSVMLLAAGAWSFTASRAFGRARMSDRKRYYVSSVLGFLPVLYLTLLSMGGASVWGVILILLFTGLMLFYVLRRGV